MTSPETPPTSDELRAFRRRSFSVMVALSLTLVGLGVSLRLAGIPRPFGVLIGAWIAAVHFFQPTYPGLTPSSTPVRVLRSVALGALFGALAHWVVTR